MRYRMSRIEALCELLLSSAGLVLLTLFLPSSPSLVLGDAARILEFTPIWALVYVPFVLLTAANVVNSSINLARPLWTPARAYARIALHAGTLLILFVLSRSRGLVAAKAGATLPDGESVARLADSINVSCEIGLIAASMVKVVQIAWEIVRVTSLRGARPTERGRVFPAASQKGAIGQTLFRDRCATVTIHRVSRVHGSFNAGQDS
jgi:hypothetical protein